MLWQPIAEPQRLSLRGYAGLPMVGRSAYTTASEKPNHAGRRLR